MSSIVSINVDDKKDFLKKSLKITLPIMAQNGITNFVSFLDNIMIGRVGTNEMTGVAICNQLFFIFYLCVFGAISGAGIFTAQYFGQKNVKGVRDTFRYKIVMTFIIMVSALLIFIFLGNNLINLYLLGDASTSDPVLTLMYGKSYMLYMLPGLLFYTIECCYSSTLRETGETVVPMIASMVAVFINLIFNYILIYGKFGFPVLGVIGAAIATVLSRIVQCLIVMIYTHTHKDRHPFITGCYKSFRFEVGKLSNFLVMSIPLIINETFWAGGLAAENQAFSVRGLDVVAAMNISSTISNVFNISFIAFGDAVAIIVGQLLGAGKLKEAKRAAFRIIKYSVMIASTFGILMFIFAPFFAGIYNITNEVYKLAISFMRVAAIYMIVAGFLHPVYFTIRSGGRTIITFLFDSFFLIVVSVPLAYALVYFTSLDVISCFVLVNAADLIKCIVGFILLVKGIWIQNIVNDSKNV